MKWSSFKKRSISRDLTISLILLMILFEGMLMLAVYHRQERLLLAELEAKADDYAQNLSEVLVVPVWDYDDEQIVKIGIGFARNVLVEAVRITDADGNVLFNAGEVKETDHRIVRDAEIQRSDQHIGSVRFYLSTAAYREDLAQLRDAIILVLLASLVVIIVTTGILLRVFMRRPMKFLLEGIDRLSQGDYTHGFEEIHYSELAGIADQFQQMASDVQSRERSLQVEVAERKRAEERIRDSEAKTRALLDAIPDVMFQLDHQGSFVDYKGALQGLYARPGELIGKNLEDVLPPKVCEIYFNKLQETLETGRSTVFEYEIPLEDAPAYFECRLVAIKKDQLLAIVRNITESILATDEKNRLEEQLRRAQKMEAIGMLAGGVAHDLNNVLSGVVSYPELVLMDLPGDSPMRKPIETIQASGERAAEIIQDLLTLARRNVSVSEVVDLNDIIEDYLNSPEFAKLKRDHPDLQIDLELAPKLLPVTGSPVHLSKTVMNLISNAAEALEEEGHISIITSNQYIDTLIKGYDDIQEGDYVVITVSDDGIGIKSEDIERVFEPFYTKKIMGRSGTGLGMAVVWGAVKDHSGYIDVQSRETIGTDITIYLPASRQIRQGVEDFVSPDEYRGQNEHILVIDDVPEQREIATHMLKKLGYRVTAVASGEAAIDFVSHQSVDLLVLDMIMEPGIDGLETYRRILNLYPRQKAIITSGFSESRRVRSAETLGVGAYLKKPYLIETLGLAVRRELDRQKTE